MLLRTCTTSHDRRRNHVIPPLIRANRHSAPLRQHGIYAHDMARLHVPFFRIFYSTTYTSLYIIQLILLAITPASLIYSSIKARALQYIFIVGGVYALTAVSVILIYSSRLYSNRTVLAAVGKSWIPVEEGEVSKSLRKLIKTNIDRSNLIAFECRPRNLASHLATDLAPIHADAEQRLLGRLVTVDPVTPPWGPVYQAGWSSPNPAETTLSPHIHFSSVISELPNLLEARIVSLGGPSRSAAALSEPDECPQTHHHRHKPLQSLRDYLDTLSQLFVLPPCAPDFVDRYEHARFAGRPLSETDFVILTSVFAELLSGLRAPMTPAIPASVTANNNYNAGRMTRSPTRPRSRAGRNMTRPSLSTSRSRSPSAASGMSSVRDRSRGPGGAQEMYRRSLLSPAWSRSGYATSLSRRSSSDRSAGAGSVLLGNGGR